MYVIIRSLSTRSVVFFKKKFTFYFYFFNLAAEAFQGKECWAYRLRGLLVNLGSVCRAC